MTNDIIKIKSSDKKENINNLTPELLDIGELALVRESNYERLYCKNTDNEIVPIQRIVNAGEIYIPLPTIQTEWIDTGLALLCYPVFPYFHHLQFTGRGKHQTFILILSKNHRLPVLQD